MKSKYAPILLGNGINFMVYLSPKNAAKMALNLFRTPMAGQHKPCQKEFLAYAESKELFLGKDKIQTYRWKGTKDRVLLVHGWQSNSSRWHFLIPKLQEKQYDIISMNASANGASGGRLMLINMH